MRFRSKERGTRVKDRAKNGAMKRAGRGWGFLPSLSFFGSPFISRAVKTEIPFLGLFFGSETKRKRLLRRLLLMGLAECIKITLLSLIILFFHEHQQRKHVNQGNPITTPASFVLEKGPPEVLARLNVIVEK